MCGIGASSARTDDLASVLSGTEREREELYLSSSISRLSSAKRPACGGVDEYGRARSLLERPRQGTPASMPACLGTTLPFHIWTVAREKSYVAVLMVFRTAFE